MAASAELLAASVLRAAAAEGGGEADVAIGLPSASSSSSPSAGGAAGAAAAVEDSSGSDMACPLPLRPCASASTASTATSPVPPAWLEAKADLPSPSSGIQHPAAAAAALEHERASPPVVAVAGVGKRPRSSPSSSSSTAAAASTTTTATGLMYDAAHARHAHPRRRHPERPERVDAVMAHLAASGLLSRCHLLPPPVDPAPEAALARVHNGHYLKRLARLEAATPERLEEEAEGYDSVYFNESTIDCARKAAAGLMALVEAVVQSGTTGLTPSKAAAAAAAANGEGVPPAPAATPAPPRVRNGLALIRPPGHHAEAHHARGFCVINNVAVAARHARQALGVRRVLIVDWDIHHGNGTQRMFLSEPDVLYFSVHRYDHGRFFPGTGNPSAVGDGPGAGRTVNVAWNGGGMGDAEYRAVWRRLLLPVARAFAPELVLVSAGFDGAAGDDMGGCRVTPEGFGWMTRALVDGVSSAGGRVVLALEGGYKISVLSRCVEACLLALMARPLQEEVDDDEVKRARVDGAMRAEEEMEEEEEEEDEAIAPEAAEAIGRTIEVHRQYWPCLGR